MEDQKSSSVYSRKEKRRRKIFGWVLSFVMVITLTPAMWAADDTLGGVA